MELLGEKVGQSVGHGYVGEVSVVFGEGGGHGLGGGVGVGQTQRIEHGALIHACVVGGGCGETSDDGEVPMMVSVMFDVGGFVEHDWGVGGAVDEADGAENLAHALRVEG